MAYTPRRRVGYYYDPEVGNFYYAQGHPMKPHRMRMTHNLLLAYGIFDKMDVLTTPRASDREMTRFHSDEYINFLKIVTPESVNDHYQMLSRFNVLEDCPVFDGLWEYCQIAAGGSLAGAARLNTGESSVAINWAGGLHHAKKAEASGFCYINDCVLAILELLKVHSRVLYVDIDIHHGDGVEEAFYTTDRVMTASFHKFGDYFPGTGDVGDIGIGKGKYYSANFPLRDGIDDESYRQIFVPVMTRIMEWYRPGAVVLQCGADSLSGDRLGCFNLSLLGHAQCVDFFKGYDTPLLLLGGGGYTIRNVARCWAYETSRVVGEKLADELPFSENYEFYGPEFRLHIVPSNMENHNTQAELERTKALIFENLRHLPSAPSTPFIDVPRLSPLGVHRRENWSDEEDPDFRHKNHRTKTVIDYAGSDDEDDDQYISSLRHARRKAKRSNFPRRRFPVLATEPDHSAHPIPSTSREEFSPIRQPERSSPTTPALPLPPPLPAEHIDTKLGPDKFANGDALDENHVHSRDKPSVTIMDKEPFVLIKEETHLSTKSTGSTSATGKRKSDAIDEKGKLQRSRVTGHESECVEGSVQSDDEARAHNGLSTEGEVREFMVHAESQVAEDKRSNAHIEGSRADDDVNMVDPKSVSAVAPSVSTGTASRSPLYTVARGALLTRPNDSEGRNDEVEHVGVDSSVVESEQPIAVVQAGNDAVDGDAPMQIGDGRTESVLRGDSKAVKLKNLAHDEEVRLQNGPNLSGSGNETADKTGFGRSQITDEGNDALDVIHGHGKDSRSGVGDALENERMEGGQSSNRL